MPFGPFVLQWRVPSPNPPKGSPLPEGITRTYINTPSGPLELLSAIPSTPVSANQPPLFFAHGGFGCAEVWLSYLQFFASKGYPCYAVSYRGHGKSWYPGFWSMYFTTRGTIASDLVAGIKEVEKLEKEKRQTSDNVRVILISHSAGGALSQYVLSRGLAKAHAFCMFAAVPGFGSFGCYKFWSLTAPIHFPYRLYHPKYILANTKQVHDAFFTPSTPVPIVESLERLLAPYESMLWPLQALFRFVTGPDVLSSITGWRLRKPSSAEGIKNTPSGVTDNLLVIAAEHDVLCTPAISSDAASRYRAAFREMVEHKKIDGVSGDDLRTMRDQEGDFDGVGFRLVHGVAHHLQNEEHWERGAQEILTWLRRL